MRILYDSKQPQYKTPFGTLVPDQICTLNIHIPATVLATKVTCLIKLDDGTTTAQDIPMEKTANKGPYEIWTGSFSFAKTGLYFYYFFIERAISAFSAIFSGVRPYIWSRGGTLPEWPY